MSVSSFDVFKKMGIDDLDIRLGTDLLRADKVKAGSTVAIGIGGDVVTGIATGDLAAVLIVYNRKQFTVVKNELSISVAPAKEPA